MFELRELHRRPAVAVHVRVARVDLELARRAFREVHAARHVHDLDAVHRGRGCGLVLVGSHPLLVVVDAVRARHERDVRALRIDVDGVRLADVGGQADLGGRRRIGDVDDLEPALLVARDRERALVVAAARGVGGIDDDLRVAGIHVQVRELDERVALRRGFGVVLEAGDAGCDAGTRGRRVADDVLRIDLAVRVRQLDDGLPGGVRARGERAHGGVREPAGGEEVEVAMRVAGRDRRDELPFGVLAAGVDAGRERRGLGESRRRVVELVGHRGAHGAERRRARRCSPPTWFSRFGAYPLARKSTPVRVPAASGQPCRSARARPRAACRTCLPPPNPAAWRHRGTPIRSPGRGGDGPSGRC